MEKKEAPKAIERVIFLFREHKSRFNSVFLAILSLIGFFFTGQELPAETVFWIRVLAVGGLLMSLLAGIPEDRLTDLLARRLLNRDLQRLKVRASAGEDVLTRYIAERYHPAWSDEKVIHALQKQLTAGANPHTPERR